MFWDRSCLSYDLFNSVGGGQVADEVMFSAPLAEAVAVVGLYSHVERALVEIDFGDGAGLDDGGAAVGFGIDVLNVGANQVGQLGGAGVRFVVIRVSFLLVFDTLIIA